MAEHENRPRRQVRHGEILTTGDFAERARHRLDFSRGANVRVDPDQVPAPLRHLIPLVETWAIVGSGPQLVFIEHLRRQAPEVVDHFVNSIRPAVDDIRAWIRTVSDAAGPRDVPAAVSHFAYTLSSYALAKPTDPDLLARGRRKSEALKAAGELERARQEAGEAMREKRYPDVVDLLGPHEAEITGADLKRLELARKRATG